MLTLPLGSARRLGFAAAAVAGVVALAAALWGMASGDAAGAAASGAVRMPSLLAAGSHPANAAAPQGGGPRSIAQVEEALFVKGSLRGTDHPAWGTARGEPVKPNRALRDRFDYYLLAMGEASLAELTALVKAHAERDLGAEAAAEILGVWQRYLQLQQHVFQQVANPADPLSMQAALQEHQQVRQGVLGLHWAQAFYGEEEQALAEKLSLALNGQPTRHGDDRRLFTPLPGTDPQTLHEQRVERFGAEAAERLRSLDEETARWDQRLAAVRAQVEAARRNPSLSAPQRDDAIARALDSAYPDPTERLRASGLLGL